MRDFPFLVMVLVVGMFGMPAHAAVAPGAKPILVFSTADIARVVQAIGESFTAQSGTPVKVTSGGSHELARRLLSGTPADLFIPAETGVFPRLQQAGLVDGASSRIWASNRLVVVSLLSATAVPATPEELADPRYRAIALPDPELAPTGMRARESLTYFKVWEAVRSRLLAVPDAAAALEAMESAKADLAIVHASDARRDPRVKVVLVFPTQSHRAIEYPVALVAHSEASPAVRPFLKFLESEPARGLLVEAGFVPAFP